MRGIDLAVAEHSVVCLIGASGSGKSTLLRCVNLLEPIDEGRILLRGEDVTRRGVDVNGVRRRIGIVFQAFNLFPHMSVLGNVTSSRTGVQSASSRADGAEGAAVPPANHRGRPAVKHPAGSLGRMSSVPLADRLDEVLHGPAAEGTVELIVRRPQPESREILEAAELTLEDGLAGDCWRARGTSRGSADPDAQVTLMSSRVAALLAGDDRERWALAGDQLYVDLDLRQESLPAGSRLAVGSAVLEITALPHTGCAKFTRRFGSEAIRLVNSREGRALRLRGVNARVVEPGRVRRGDSVRRLG